MIEKIAARVIQVVFHPLLIPVMGMIILFRTNLYIAFISGEMRQIIVMLTFMATCLVPLFFIFTLRLFTKHYYKQGKFPGISIILLFTAMCYYIGYYSISMFKLAGFYKAAFLAGALVLISLSLISLRWNISPFMAGTGAIAGLTIAIMLRLGIYDPVFLFGVLLAGGLAGFSQLSLEKNSPAQIYAGYLLAFGILFSIFSSI